MSSPADKSSRPLILVIQPFSLRRNKAIPAVSQSTCTVGRGECTPPTTGMSCGEPSATALPALISFSPTLTSLSPTTTDIEKDPHNEVERRRKQRISKNIKALADTLSPPCHCGKTTRAEILERVVEQVKGLQQKNAELKSKMEKVPAQTNKEELCSRAVALIEENLGLWALLHDSKLKQRNSSKEPQLQVGHSTGEETQDMEVTSQIEIEHREDAPTVCTDGEMREEVEAVDKEVLQTVSGRGSGEERSSGGDSGDTDEGGGREKENGRKLEEVREGDIAGREEATRGSAVEQPWPVSSLLSDNSKTGPRDHPAFNLPILSPTYIAEHCSTAACEPHFFSTAVALPLSVPQTTASNLTDVGRPNLPCSSTPMHAPPIVASTDLETEAAASVCTALNLMSSKSVSTSSVYTFLARGTMAPCTSSPAAISCTSRHLPPSRISPSTYLTSPPSRQSIVQPWVGGSSSSNNAIIHHTTDRHPSCPTFTHAQPPSTQADRRSVRHVRRHASDPHDVATASHYAHHRYSRHNPSSRSARSQTGPSLHTPVSCYSDPCSYNSHFPTVSAPSVFPNHTHTQAHLPQGRSHSSESSYSFPSTGAPFHLQTGSLNSAVFLPPSNFSAPSIDPYFQHTPPHLHVHDTHTLPASHHRHNAHTQPSHDHTHHLHQHSYDLPHPNHPTPTFTHPHSHPHHPQHPTSHHNTVWRPYSDRRRTATRFSLSDILSPSPSVNSPTLSLATVVSPPAHQNPGGRIPSFFVDHLLDDL